MLARALAALVLTLAVPASAHAYVRLAPIRMDEPAAIAGDEVLLGRYAPTGATLAAYSIDDGSARPLALRGAGSGIFALAASERLAAVITATQPPLLEGGQPDPAPPYAAYLGPRSGPLQPNAVEAADVAVTGGTVITIERDGIYARDGGRPRRLVRLRRFQDARDLRAAGHWAAYVSWRGDAEIVVHDLRTGRERYRVPFEQDYALTASGRVVRLELLGGDEDDDWPARILTATPARPRLRPAARLRLHTPFLAAGGRRIVVAERVGALGRLVALDLRGRRRVISAPMNHVGQLAFDGRTLTFAAGLCTYAGPLPRSAPRTEPRDGCFDVPPELESVRRLPDGRVALRLSCVAPPSARCRASLRVGGDDAVLHEQTVTVRPGESTVPLPLPPGAAWVELVVDGDVRHGTSIPPVS